MFSSASTCHAGWIAEIRTNICFLLLKVLRSHEFCVSRHHVDMPYSNEFFCWVHGHRFESGTNLNELVRDKVSKRSVGSHFTFVFGTVE